ncbi:MAG: DUF4290 domain-containing protein [Bacteroidota bacterium]
MPNIQYATQLEPIRNKEYGRNLQMMVEKLKEEPDPDTRARLAGQLIRVMNTVVPNETERQEYEKKLWQGLFEIAHYELGIEPPFPITPKQERENKLMGYYPYSASNRQFGVNIELMIEHALSMDEESEEYDNYVHQIARLMKLYLKEYTNTVPNDKIVFRHLANLSDGHIQLDPDEMEVRIGKTGRQYHNKSVNILKRKPKQKKKTSQPHNKVASDDSGTGKSKRKGGGRGRRRGGRNNNRRRGGRNNKRNRR